MPDLNPLAKMLIAGGLIMILMGAALLIGPHLPFGRLPGDIYLKKGNFTFYFPVLSSIILSIILTIILNLFFK